MGKEEALEKKLFQAIVNYVRVNHADAIDKAYEYFWDEKYPDEFLNGTALDLGFINFEDWLVFDFKADKAAGTFIDLYIRDNKELRSDELALLGNIKNYRLSLYEVMSVSRDKKVTLEDMLRGGEAVIREKAITKGLKKGDIFAARLLVLDGRTVMSGCVYPYKREDKKMVLAYIDRMFGRYKRNEKPDGTMEVFLKDYGDIFNIAWMNIILNRMQSDV